MRRRKPPIVPWLLYQNLPFVLQLAPPPSRYPLLASENALTSLDIAALKQISSSHAFLFLRFWTWSKSYLRPAAYERRLQANKRAAALEIYNAEFSPIYRLPYDILIDILQLLTGADNISLRLSFRRFASAVLQAVRRPPALHDRLQVQHRLLRHRYPELVDDERVDVAMSDTFICSGCHVSHLRAMFKISELPKSAYSRQCIGFTGSFRLCEHQSLTRGNLDFDIPMYCMEDLDMGDILFNCELYLSIKHDRITDGMFSTSVFKIADDAPYLGISFINLQVYCKLWAKPICPHICSNEPYFQKQVTLGRFSSSPSQGRSRSLVNAVFAPPFTNANLHFQCAVKHCETKVSIDRLVEPGSGIVVASISRGLGKLHNPLDPAWLAQLESADGSMD